MVLMTLAVILVLIIVVVVVLAFAGEQVSELFDKAEDNIQKQKEADVRNPDPNEGIWLCDLVIEAGGDIDDRPFNLGESFIIKMGSESQTFPQGIEYEWKNCYIKGEPALNSFLPAQWFGKMLDFAILIGDEIFDIEIELTGKDDGRVITSFEERGLKETIRIEGGLVQLPQGWKTVHLVEDIVCQDYELEAVFPDNQIDQDSSFFAGADIAGSPYFHTIEKPDPKFGVCI